MTGLPGFAAWGLAGLLVCTALLILRRPVAQLIRLILRSSVGLAALALFSQVGQALGVTLGVNLVNALVLGLLGVPGFGLLLMLQWVLNRWLDQALYSRLSHCRPAFLGGSSCRFQKIFI